MKRISRTIPCSFRHYRQLFPITPLCIL